jgi:hypothetical protein
MLSDAIANVCFVPHGRYRAPGEHWTEKFKHVVGIIHTNYFAYAQEQPAALIRVRSEAIPMANQSLLHSNVQPYFFVNDRRQGCDCCVLG